MKKGQVGNVMIGVGITVIMAVVLLSIVFGFITNEALNTKTQPNETLSVTLNTTIQLDNANIIASSMVISNASGGTLNLGGSNYTLNTVMGTLVIGNITSEEQVVNEGMHDLFGGAAGTLYAVYNYYPQSYLTGNTSRVLAGIIPVLFVLAILVFVVGYMGKER